MLDIEIHTQTQTWITPGRSHNQQQHSPALQLLDEQERLGDSTEMRMLRQTLFGLLSLEQDDLVGLVVLDGVEVVLQMLEHSLVLWLGSWRSLPEKDGDGHMIFIN